MLNVKYIEFLNEDMAVISTRILRDAMHDVIVELGPKETIDVEEMSDVLMKDYKITISPSFLDKFLDDFLKKKKGDNKVKTFFRRDDQRWLGVIEVKGAKEIRNNLLYLKPSLTKHKRKLFVEQEKKKLDDAYKAGMKDMQFSEEVIKNSLVLQKPGDSEDIMKYIYSDIIVKKYYDNIYDNCWKLMMAIGRNNKLDRRRGWFKLAPQSVRDEFIRSGKVNYELTKPKIKKENPKRDIHDPPETKKNLSIIDKQLNRYKNWDHFISDTTLRILVNLINSLQIKVSSSEKDVELNDFLTKLDQLTYILIRYYDVDKKNIIMFYTSIGLAGYLREWEAMHVCPKINDF